MYGIDLHNNKDRYFTFGDNKRQKFAFLPFRRQITVKKVSPVSLELEKFKSEHLNEAEISLHSPGQISRQLSAIDFTLQRSSRQCQSSHLSHENVTKSPNPFQHYSQCLGNFTSLASASPPNPP
ncbi:hypothetical protein O181_093147 [Austropuccinia psidii MF-1]|uniref:Uncharacterized protein n=1 Tax=Austropuccinia psidii MF-1 TaxID=1389203 RepID=A0A9Q3PA90_9BASI|nr:hypothetical protein [Austropuccinia psidii MF-1]